MNDDRRPDPEAILERIREQEQRESRAKLKIFFGACAGVGKTYAMLSEARERVAAGTDVLVGLVETHGRTETEALLVGLPVLPRLESDYRGTVLREFDLDAALRRHPGLILLDELAHTNVPGSRHTRRWQDVEELLAAGIDVYTTLNVQHVESLNDVISQITTIRVRETVPDSILDRADEVELVDIPPDDLLQRLREGKVYFPEQAANALEGFFRKGNLIALRELALRQTAQRVDAQMESYRRAEGIAGSWPVGGRILVCVGDPARGAALIRATRRMAAGLKAEWIAVHVDVPGRYRSDAHRDHVADVLGFAEELGAETAMLSGPRISDEILGFAGQRNAARIVVGKPSRPEWQTRLLGSLVQSLVRESEGIDVYVLSAAREDEGEAPAAPPPERIALAGYVGVLGAVLACTAAAFLLRGRLERANLVMLYLVGVTGVAVRYGRAPAALASVLSVAAFDFFFVPPFYSFSVTDTQYLVTFAVMLLVALVISGMAVSLRQQTEAARMREARAAALYRLSRELSGLRGVEELVRSALHNLADVVDARAVVLVPEVGRLAVAAGDRDILDPGGHELGVAQWAFDNARPAGLGMPTLPAARAVHLPLVASKGSVGVLVISPRVAGARLRPDQLQLLEAFGNQVALAIERADLAAQAEASRVERERDRLRSTLLSSVSHDLRTPLATITGAATGLLDGSGALSPEQRAELAQTIAEEAQRLNRLVSNLLDMTRLESGALQLAGEWQPLEEVVGAALERAGSRLQGRDVSVLLPRDLGLVKLDDVLIEQLIYNLLDNALKYTPAGSPLEIEARRDGPVVELAIRDRGPGIPPGREEQVFEKFYRARTPGDPGGVGLGLAICRGIVEAHGGAIAAANRPGGGAEFRFRLPVGGEAPGLEPEPPEVPREEGA